MVELSRSLIFPALSEINSKYMVFAESRTHTRTRGARSLSAQLHSCQRHFSSASFSPSLSEDDDEEEDEEEEPPEEELSLSESPFTSFTPPASSPLPPPPTSSPSSSLKPPSSSYFSSTARTATFCPGRDIAYTPGRTGCLPPSSPTLSEDVKIKIQRKREMGGGRKRCGVKKYGQTQQAKRQS